VRRRLGLPLGTSPMASWLWVADPAPRRSDPVLLWRQRRAAPALGTEGGVGFGSAANVGFGEVPRVHAGGWSGRCLFFLFFLKKKFAECFLGARQRLCRVPYKKQSVNKCLPLNGLPSVIYRV